MKLAFLVAASALATSRAAASTSAFDQALNRTNASSTSRRLLDARYFRMVGVDIVGKDIGNNKMVSARSCLGYSLGQSGTASTWTNNDSGCWWKDTDHKVSSTVPKAEAESFTFLYNPPSSFIWSGTKDGFDMAGGFDIDNKPGGTIGKCFEVCNANKDCFAVTWTNYNDGTCWLKSRASSYIPKVGAKSAYVAREYNIWES